MKAEDKRRVADALRDLADDIEKTYIKDPGWEIYEIHVYRILREFQRLTDFGEE